MKLIRNQTEDGTCKYALVLLSKMQPAERDSIIHAAKIPANNILIGNESPDSQFFVMKYKDKFTASGLRGYLWAVEKELEKMPASPERTNLEEYAVEIAGEIEKAESVGCKIPD